MDPIRFHHLKAFGRAPIFAQHALGEGAGDDDEQTYAMERGTAVHAITFGTREVTFYPGKRDERAKAYQEFLASHKDAEILTANEYRKAREMAASLMRHPRAVQLLRGPGVINEHTILTKLAGRECRGTPDARGPEGIVELKCTGKAGPVDFFYQVKRMGYHAQLAWYARIARSSGVAFGPDRYIVAVEDKAPHVVQVYRLGAALVEEGDRLATMWFEGLRTCEDSSVWPGYGPDEMELEAPYQDDGLDWGSDDEAAA